MRSVDPFNVNFLELDLFYRYSNYVVCLLFLKKRRLRREKGHSGRVVVRDLMSGTLEIVPSLFGPLPIYLG